MKVTIALDRRETEVDLLAVPRLDEYVNFEWVLRGERYSFRVYVTMVEHTAGDEYGEPKVTVSGEVTKQKVSSKSL